MLCALAPLDGTLSVSARCISAKAPKKARLALETKTAELLPAAASRFTASQLGNPPFAAVSSRLTARSQKRLCSAAPSSRHSLAQIPGAQRWQNWHSLPLEHPCQAVLGMAAWL